MARAVYSLRIFSHAGLTTTPAPVGPIVPDGLIYVVRDIDVVELADEVGAIMDVINPTLGPLWRVRIVTGDIPGYHSWRGRAVYGEGEQVGFSVSSGTWSITCSGYQLTLP